MKAMMAWLLLLAATLPATAQNLTMTPAQLKDKIRGGWAGQIIGVAFGGPHEFRYQGSMINDYQPLPWDSSLFAATLDQDDLYLDISFVEVFEKEGLDAPVASFGNAFAHAGYDLWHANQSARYNILQGMPATQSGHWLNNPHADDIDYQIESDFAGLMSPGMPNTASAISDKIGHIMNYGDGWYGGVYFGAMYALAFTHHDIQQVVKEALQSIPAGTKYHSCMSDVIRWHQQYPNDWKQTWFELQKKWTDEIGCPDGVFSPFNIDVIINSAYVVMGLLYGNGDFEKTLAITTRAGQDADCNPASAAGILGTLLGYAVIPAKWKQGLEIIADKNFNYTHTSFNKVCELSYQHALENIQRYGGQVTDQLLTIKTQAVQPVKFEQGFTDMQPFDRKWMGQVLKDEFAISFTGNAFVIHGEFSPFSGGTYRVPGLNEVAEIKLYIDGTFIETIQLPMAHITRKNELAFKYQLENKPHQVKIVLANTPKEGNVMVRGYVLYRKPQ